LPGYSGDWGKRQEVFFQRQGIGCLGLIDEIFFLGENGIKNIVRTILLNRVATRGGITEEGTKIIGKRLPETINEMFEKTLEKRKKTVEKAQEEFSV
jgi:hypothetical protein